MGAVKLEFEACTLGGGILAVFGSAVSVGCGSSAIDGRVLPDSLEFSTQRRIGHGDGAIDHFRTRISLPSRLVAGRRGPVALGSGSVARVCAPASVVEGEEAAERARLPLVAGNLVGRSEEHTSELQSRQYL